MIKIEFEKVEGKLARFTSEGHAGYASKGNDIVCASVSAILIGVANELERCGDLRSKTEMTDGYLKVKAIPCHRTSVLLGYAYHTLKDIEESYLGYIQVTIK